jgi:hypothetical protein
MVTPPSRRRRLVFFGSLTIAWVALLVFKLRNAFQNFGVYGGLFFCLFVAVLGTTFAVVAIRQTRAISRRPPSTTNEA